MISFSDLFTITMNPVQVILTLIVGLLVGLYVWFIYKKTFSGVMYSRTYGMTLVMMTIVTALMLMLINNSLTLSLGMVGALSIVRFRTAVKDPMDLAFLFWSISVGIICGATLYEVAVEASILITLVMLGLHYVPNVKPALILLVNGTDAEVQEEVKQVLEENTSWYKIKSRNVSASGMDMIVELKTKQEDALAQKILAVPGVENATLMTHDGEVTY